MRPLVGSEQNLVTHRNNEVEVDDLKLWELLESSGHISLGLCIDLGVVDGIPPSLVVDHNSLVLVSEQAVAGAESLDPARGLHV